MSEVKIQGVDGVRFDDTYIDGRKVNLALGKDTRPAKIKYAKFYKTNIPLILASLCLFLGVTVLKTFTIPLMLLSLLFMRIMEKKTGPLPI